jgi:GNAT superfamily N-acetyltransferase
MNEWQRGDYSISTDKTKLDLKVIHTYLHSSYWAKGIPEEVVAKAIDGSLNFGVYKNAQLKGLEQVGFARVISDFATFMYVADVFILQAHRGQGLGVWLMDRVVNFEALQGIRTWTLLTADAHGLYEKFGFEVPEPGRFMRRKIAYPYPLKQERE